MLIVQGAQAGAWVQEAGHGQAVLTLRGYQTDRYYDLAGRGQSTPDYWKWELNPYGEWGVTGDLTLGASLSAQAVQQDRGLPATITVGNNTYRTGSRSVGIGDSEFFARYRLWQGNGAVLSFQPLVKAPSLSDRRRLPSVGSEYWDGEIMLLAGYGAEAWGGQHFIEGGLAWRKRGGRPEDQVRAYARLGVRTHPDWLWMASLEQHWRLGTAVVPAGTLAAISDYNLTKAELSAVYTLREGVRVQFGGFSHLRAENTGGGGGGLVSFWFDF